MKKINIILSVFVAIFLLNSIPVDAAPLSRDCDHGRVIILAKGGFGGHGPGDGTGNDGFGPGDGTGYGPSDCTGEGGTGSDNSTEQGHHGQSDDQGNSGNSYGPGDGTGNDGFGPGDGTGYGPGDCSLEEETGDIA